MQETILLGLEKGLLDQRQEKREQDWELSLAPASTES